MANSAAVCTSFKVELLNGIHAFGTSVVRGATTADTFKAALYLASGSQGAGTTAYSTTNELAGTGNYTQGGKTVVWVAPSSTGTTAFSTLSATITWTALTSSGAFDCLTVYNSTQSNKAVAIYTFSSQSITAGDFSLTMPTNDATTGLLRIA